MSALPSRTAPEIRLDNVTFSYRRHPAVRELSGRFAPGSLTAIIGPNGAGKSTLLKGLVGILKPGQGQIIRHGLKRSDIAYLPQSTELDRNFPISVIDFIALGTWSVTGMFRSIDGREASRVQEAIEAVGLSGLEHRIIGTLSGGQLQRALFARMLLQDARLLLLDEPFSAIDSKTMADLLALIHRWHGDNRTIIAVLHDLDMVAEHFPESLLLAGCKVAWGPTDQVLTPTNLQTARHLLEASDSGRDVEISRVA